MSQKECCDGLVMSVTSIAQRPGSDCATYLYSLMSILMGLSSWGGVLASGKINTLKEREQDAYIFDKLMEELKFESHWRNQT